MRPEDVQSLMERRPFQRLRLHLTGGIVFEVHHPDMAIVGRSTVRLRLPTEQGIEREGVLALVHIVWIEILTPLTPTGPAGNGEE